MRQCMSFLIVAGVLVLTVGAAWAADQVIDVLTRPGVTERFILIAPDDPRATVVLFAGDDGALQIAPDGRLGNGSLASNFLVRSRQLFADQRLMVAVVDAPSDRQSLADTMREAWRASFRGFRQSSEHVADIKAVIAWLRQKANVPVWLVGTSRGTGGVRRHRVAAAPRRPGWPRAHIHDPCGPAIRTRHGARQARDPDADRAPPGRWLPVLPLS